MIFYALVNFQSRCKSVMFAASHDLILCFLFFNLMLIQWVQILFCISRLDKTFFPNTFLPRLWKTITKVYCKRNGIVFINVNPEINNKGKNTVTVKFMNCCRALVFHFQRRDEKNKKTRWIYMWKWWWKQQLPPFMNVFAPLSITLQHLMMKRWNEKKNTRSDSDYVH